MKITLQPSSGNLLKRKARDVGALAGVFDETANLNPPDLVKLRAADKLATLQELYAKAYEKSATLRSMIFDLKSLDVVRLIEDVDEREEEDAT